MTNRQAGVVVADALSKWTSPLEQAVLGTTDPSEIVALLDDFCGQALGEHLDTLTFYRRGVGAVFGVILADGRRVVVKVHRLDLLSEGLHGIRLLQAHLADRGLPVPRPLGRPRPMGRGVAAAEEMIDGGHVMSAHEPNVRWKIVSGLHRFVEAALPLLGEVRLAFAHPFDLPSDELWPPPHDLRFDLSLPGGEWIDEEGAAARATLRKPVGREVIGHTDWRVENLRLDGEITGIFDWDSVAVSREPALVGANAAGFTADWTGGDWDPYPSPAETVAFVAEYERARHTPFSSDERTTLRAAHLYSLAYNARCEHSDVMLGVLPDPGPERGWRALLRAQRTSGPRSA